MAHDHDCFAVAKQSLQLLEKEPHGRTGFFLYVGNDQDEDSHYRGNTAFAASILHKLVRDVLHSHVSTGCVQCDRTALALAAAREAFVRTMRGTPGSC